MLTVSFNYQVTSGTVNMSATASSSFAVYLYAVNSRNWIQLDQLYLNGSGRHTGQFQVETGNFVKYQLAIVNINATAGSYTLKVDDFFVGPQSFLGYSPISTDPQLVPNFTMDGCGTLSNIKAFQMRQGKNLVLYGSVTIGTPTATPVAIHLPGVTIDSSVVGSDGQYFVGSLSGSSGNYGNLTYLNPWFIDLSVSTSKVLIHGHKRNWKYFCSH
jgi:hypothetical protein